MSATPTAGHFSWYRDDVKDQIQGGEPFSEVEDSIELADLTTDEKAALWLFAFSVRDLGGGRGNAN
jgi:hypothetical protein